MLPALAASLRSGEWWRGAANQTSPALTPDPLSHGKESWRYGRLIGLLDGCVPEPGIGSQGRGVTSPWKDSFHQPAPRRSIQHHANGVHQPERAITGVVFLAMSRQADAKQCKNENPQRVVGRGCALAQVRLECRVGVRRLHLRNHPLLERYDQMLDWQAQVPLFGGGLNRGDMSVVVIDAYFDSCVVHGQGFAERTRFSNQYPAAVAERTIERFDDAGLAAAFGAGPVGGGG